MSTHFQHVRGEPYGIRYTFDKAGEGIPMHQHGTSTEHSIKVERGAVEFYGAWGRLELGCGATLEFNSILPHEIAALEDGTVIFNEFKNGMPAEYAGLPEHELSGQYDLQLVGASGAS